MPLPLKSAAAIGVVAFTSVFWLLMLLGDFTGYTYSPDRDVIISRLPTHIQVLYSTVISCAIVVFFLRVSNWIWPRRRAMVLFAIFTLEISAVWFLFGSYKTLLGGPDYYEVKYDCPYGMERLTISLVVGVIVAAGIIFVLQQTGHLLWPKPTA